MKEKNQSKQILKKLVSFSIPLILSGMLQQLFNWVDALIVGNIIGERALAGIGATTSIYNLFIMMIIGFTSGLSVLFAQQYGERKHQENAKTLASYSIILPALLTMIAITGIIFSASILEIMNTAPSLMEHAKQYLRIIFVGIPFLTIYNVYSAVLRGMGNSKVPFIAVLISSIVNAVLDIIFIVILRVGVPGAAMATVISQIAMTIYIVYYTITHYPELRFSLFREKREKYIIKKGMKYSAPPAIQSSISSIGNLILQRFMNGFGEQTVAAITTAYRVDTMLLLPIVNFSTAISTLVAQETGAGNPENAKKVFRLGTIMMSMLSIILAIIILFTGKLLLSLFGLEAETVEIGVGFFNRIALFYVINGIAMSMKGYLEGTADLFFSSAAGICSLGVRILCSYAFVNIWGNMVIAYAEAIAWIFLCVVFLFRCIYNNSSTQGVKQI